MPDELSSGPRFPGQGLPSVPGGKPLVSRCAVSYVSKNVCSKLPAAVASSIVMIPSPMAVAKLANAAGTSAGVRISNPSTISTISL